MKNPITGPTTGAANADNELDHIRVAVGLNRPIIR